MITYAHPALSIIARLERMWSETDQIASDRAKVLVEALVKEGLIKGGVFNEQPPGETLEQRRAAFRVDQTAVVADMLRRGAFGDVP